MTETVIDDATPLIDDAGTRRAQMREVWTGRESNRSSENDPKRALLCGVTSGSWDGEKMILRDQVLEVRPSSTPGCRGPRGRTSRTSGTRRSSATNRMEAW